MRLEIYQDDSKLEFENVLFTSYFEDLGRNVDDINLPRINFSELHYLLNEKNKYYLELSFQHQKKESIDG